MGESSKLEYMKSFEKLLLDIYNKSVEECVSNGIPSRTSRCASAFCHLEGCVTAQVNRRMELASQSSLQ